MAKRLTPAQKATKTIVNTYGPSFYSEIGAMGGIATLEKYGTQYLTLLGTLGNENISQRRRTRVRQAINAILNASNR